MKTHIVLHHSLTKDGDTVSWGAIRDYHVGVYEWEDIGYHFGVELIGDEYEILLGRMPDQEGAHCRELHMNTFGIGICMVGNFDTGPPHPYQMDKTVELVRHLMRAHHIPRENVIGHREAGLLAGYDWRLGQYKSCPGSFFDLNHFRSYLD